MGGVALEVGPTAVRVMGRAPRDCPDEWIRAALAAVDDPLALVGEHPVAAADLWCRVVAAVVGPNPEEVLVVHPSWWPQARADRVAAAAATVCRSVGTQRRAAFVARGAGGREVVVEVVGQVVAVSVGGHDLAVLTRSDAAGIGMAVGRRLRTGGGRVVVDCPEGNGADFLEMLLGAGIDAHSIDIHSLAIAAVAPPAGDPLPRRRRGIPAVAVAAAVAAAAAISILGGSPSSPPESAPVVGLEFADLVEGRVAVRIPAAWAVERITAGPGSRRVQVTAPERDAALHITQAYAPESSVAQAADALTRAVAGQPAGVFSGLRSTVGAGRDAVTYRETRPGRVIRWSVVLDGASRIGIGCQSAPGREDTVEEACAEAVRSAREVTGTAN